MAIINCPECKKEISDKADPCPNCGYPIKGSQNQEISDKTNKKQDYNKAIIKIIGGAAIDSLGIYLIMESYRPPYQQFRITPLGMPPASPGPARPGYFKGGPELAFGIPIVIIGTIILLKGAVEFFKK